MQRRSLPYSSADIAGRGGQGPSRRPSRGPLLGPFGLRGLGCLAVLAAAPLLVMVTEKDRIGLGCLEEETPSIPSSPGADTKLKRVGCPEGGDTGLLDLVVRAYAVSAGLLGAVSLLWYAVPKVVRYCRTHSAAEVLARTAKCGAAAALLTLLSVGSVPALFYGIRYNHFTKEAHVGHVYDSGRYLVGPWCTFVLFPMTSQTIEFLDHDDELEQLDQYDELQPQGLGPLRMRTQEGILVQLKVSLQYRLLRSNIGKLWAQLSLDFESIFIGTLRDALMEACSEFLVQQLWTERQEVQRRMHEVADRVFTERFGEEYAECLGLQLLNVRIPSNYQEAIVRTLVMEQAVSARQYEQVTATIRAHTSVMASHYEMRVKSLLAFGQANSTLLARLARATARQRRLHEEARALAGVRQNLALAGEDLVTYQLYDALPHMAHARFIFDIDGQVPGHPPAPITDNVSKSRRLKGHQGHRNHRAHRTRLPGKLWVTKGVEDLFS